MTETVRATKRNGANRKETHPLWPYEFHDVKNRVELINDLVRVLGHDLVQEVHRLEKRAADYAYKDD